MPWISVKDRLPDNCSFKKYEVKAVKGSIERKKIETVMVGMMTKTGFRFQSGDWVTVTHWKE